MTSRERVLAAIEHRQPDMVPVDLGATPSSGISAIGYSRLLCYLGMNEGSVNVYDVVQQLAQPEDAVLDLFGVDVIDLGRAFNTRPEDWAPTILATGEPARYPAWFKPELNSDGSWIARHTDGSVIARMPSGATFFDQAAFPYLDEYPENFNDLDDAMGRVLWSALAHSPWDNAGDPNFWTKLREVAIQLRRTSDRAIMLSAGCNLFEWGTFLRRMDNFLVDLLVEPENVERLLDALMERHLASLEKICAAVGDIVDIIRLGDDLGTDQDLFMNPGIYRTLFKPRHKQLCDYIKSHSTMKTFLHSCGSIHSVLPDLIDVGFDIINPVQTNARGMDPARIKKEFGKDITFWGGGVDTRVVLNNGTPEQVRAQVLERLEIFTEGSGYVFNTVHNILPDVPPENIVAMFNAIREFNGLTPVKAAKASGN